MLLLMWRKDKYYVLHGMTLNWWFTCIFVVYAMFMQLMELFNTTS